jgi:acetyltransferase EpsM
LLLGKQLLVTIELHARVCNGAVADVAALRVPECGDAVGRCSDGNPGACMAGNVRVGAGCELGSMSSIRQGTTIGSGCTIGMGSVVVATVPDHVVVVGNPARVLRSCSPW